MADTIWTIDELRTTVIAYIEMLNLELEGTKYNKAKYNEKIRSAGVNRSRGSIEYRMRNISAVFESIGLPIIQGYLPAKNVGEKVSKEIIEIINESNIFNALFIPTINEEELENNVEIIRKLNNKKEPKGIKNPEKKRQEVIIFARDPKVKAFVLQRSNGVCELCKNKGPFKIKDGNWFLEVHHLIFIALGGEDTIFNTVAVCPNCHRELHYGIEAENKKNYLIKYLNEIYNKN
jgi:5-methylcytosine-specific restriction protein A